MTIGEKIRTIRKEKGLTQKELGDKLGKISQQQIGQWETGKANPKKETLQKIANALEVDITALMDISTLSNPEPYITFETEIKGKIPGEKIIYITEENFKKYHKIFLLAFDKIIDKIYESYNTELKYYDADTGEEVVLKNPNFRELTDENKFKFFQEIVKEIRYNTILNTFSIIFL